MCSAFVILNGETYPMQKRIFMLVETKKIIALQYIYIYIRIYLFVFFFFFDFWN